jgi:hypothetical protein
VKLQIILISAWVFVCAHDVAFAQSANAPFTIADRGGVSLQTAGAAILRFRANNVLISETDVPATTPLTSGRIYTEIGGSVNTGIAIVNPNNSAAAFDFYFTDTSGNPAGSGTMTVSGNQHVSFFLDQAPLKVYTTPTFQGTFSFTSTSPVAVTALRGLTNERREFLMSSLPVIDTSLPPANALLQVPHIAAGGGWTTQILLVNPTDQTITGTASMGWRHVPYVCESVMGLRARTNERGDFLITSAPLVNESDSSTTTPMLFPQIVDGGGYSTQFVIFSGMAGQATSGNVQFLKSDGTPLQLTLK